VIQVVKAKNGWPGIYLNGDDALGAARTFRHLADKLDHPPVYCTPNSYDEIASMVLKRWAGYFERCRVDEPSEPRAPGDYSPDCGDTR